MVASGKVKTNRSLKSTKTKKTKQAVWQEVSDILRRRRKAQRHALHTGGISSIARQGNWIAESLPSAYKY